MPSQTSDCPQSCVFDGGPTDQVELKAAHILDQGTSGCCSGVLLWCSRTQEASCRQSGAPSLSHGPHHHISKGADRAMLISEVLQEVGGT